MVLCDVVTEEACIVRSFQELQTLLVQLMQRRLVPVNPIEQPKATSAIIASFAFGRPR